MRAEGRDGTCVTTAGGEDEMKTRGEHVDRDDEDDREGREGTYVAIVVKEEERWGEVGDGGA